MQTGQVAPPQAADPCPGSKSSCWLHVSCLGTRRGVSSASNPVSSHQIPPKPGHGCAELLHCSWPCQRCRAGAQGWPLHKGTWMFPLRASSRTQLTLRASQPHTHHFPSFSHLTRDGESRSAETKRTPAYIITSSSCPVRLVAAECKTSTGNEVSHSKALLVYHCFSSSSSMHGLKISCHFSLTPANLQKGKRHKKNCAREHQVKYQNNQE